MQRIKWTLTRDVLIVVICIGILLWGTFSVLGMVVHAIVLLLLAMAVAFLVTPLVNIFNKYMPRVLATLLVYILVLAGLGALFYALVFSLIQQITYFSNHLPVYVQDLPATYANFQKWLVQQGVPQTAIDKALATLSDRANALAISLADNLVSIVLIVTDVIVNVLLVAVLSFYLTVDGKRIRNSLMNLASESFKPHFRLFEDALNKVVGNYIRGQLTLAAIIGLLAGLGTFFLGINQFALIIGMLAFLFETIPMVGPTLASIPAILISLLLPDPFPRSYWIAVYFIVIQLIEGNVLGPRIVGHAVGLHPIASILALIIGAQFFGPFGALLATPVVAAAWVVIASLYNSLRGKPTTSLLEKKRSPWIRSRKRHDELEEEGIAPEKRQTGETGTQDEAQPATNAEAGSIAEQGPEWQARSAVEPIDALRLVPNRDVYRDRNTPGSQGK
ncbi:MAG TPA: AI-2E family transporter [Ktedonobacteraceae bacterium]|nr:AI-2E family transporter [Ktedonobacteraceae bacterium]